MMVCIPQLLEQTHFSEQCFIAFSLPHGIGYLVIPRPTQIASISSFSWLNCSNHTCICMWGQVADEVSNGSQWGDRLHHQQGVCIWVNARWPSLQCSQNFTCLFWELCLLHYTEPSLVVWVCVSICGVCVGKFIIALSMQPFQCVFWLSCGVGGWTDRHLLWAVSV